MPPPQNLGVSPGTHLDEEECLPFPIFTAELELLIGNSKCGKPDGVQLLELLQKLVATIPRTDKAVLKQHQRQCETMLYDVLTHGIGAAVRRLIYSCFSALYTHGDPISIYTRVNTLQTYLTGKEGMSRSTDESVRVGLLDFLTHLNSHYGRMLANAAQESMLIAARTVSKYGNQTAVRCAALRLAAAVVRGLNPLDRSAPTVHGEAWVVVQRFAKDRTCERVRSGCLKLLAAMCIVGGGPLWREGAYAAEEALRTCLTLTEDPVQAVREAAYRTLGELAAASRGKDAAEALSAEKRPAKKASAERVVNGCLRGCLVAPLVEAAVHGRREACIGMASAWMSYIGSLPRHRQHGQDPTSDILEAASTLINAVGEAGRAAAESRAGTAVNGSGELGTGLAGSEMPPLQACALYVLRRGVMAALGEAAQRKLLERLANSLDKRLATAASVVVLEAVGTLLEAVGEVTDDTAAALEQLLQPYVTSHSAATRQQAAITIAALAEAHPSAAARMLSGCLDTVASCAVQMAAPLSAAAAAAGTSNRSSSITTEHSISTSTSTSTARMAAANGGVGASTSTLGGAGDAHAAGWRSGSVGNGGASPLPSASSRVPSASLTAGDGGAATAPPALPTPSAAAPATASTIVPIVTSPSRPATPNGGTASSGDFLGSSGNSTGGSSGSGRPAPAQRALMDTCHGAALAACRLLRVTARAPLGCPARLQRRALALADCLVAGPGPEMAGNRAICREVGYLLLGTLCSLGVPQATRGPEEMAALWLVALGESARRDLDERGLFRPGGELDLAVQLWWRSVALQALSAYVGALHSGLGAAAGPGLPFGSAGHRSSIAGHRPSIVGGTSGPGGASWGQLQSCSSNRSSVLGLPHSASAALLSAQSDSALVSRIKSATGSGASGLGLGPESADALSAELAASLGPLLQPLLEMLDTQSFLLDPMKAKGGPGGILAGAAAMFTLSLLELHLRAPGGRVISSPGHLALLAKACLRPFRYGITAAAADVLTVAGLRGLLSSDDAPLGPWRPGTDPHEDALLAFTGGRGAPHLPPWLTADEYAALLSGGATAALSAAANANARDGTLPLPAGGGFGAGAAAGVLDDPLIAAPDCAVGVTAAGGIEGAVAGAGAGVVAVTGFDGGGAGPSTAGQEHGGYPQALGLEAALLTAQLVLLGRLMATSAVAQQLLTLEVILNAVQAAKSLARQSRDMAACRRLPLGVAAAVTALAAYGPSAMAARRSKAPLDVSDKVPEKLLQLAQALLPDEDAATPAAAPLSRAAAEVYAASAATGTDAWALRVVRALASEVASSAAEGRDSQQRAVLALALGAAHRARGGLAMQGAVAGSAEALVAAASRPGCAAAAAWVLHALWLVASSGGGAFVPRVKTSLQLGQELLVSSFESPALRAACARLANASVAVLGPEFSLGSWVYDRAKSLVVASGGDHGAAASDGSADNVVGGGGGGSTVNGRSMAAIAADGADGGLGMVLFVQQIILFAPKAVPPAKHVPLLLSHLLSPQPHLRAASARTLRHLAERSAEALCPAEAAPLLFAALDRENDAHIASQLRATLTTILNASAAKAPSFWLELLGDVVFAAGQPAVATSSGGAADVGRHHGADDEDDDRHGRQRGGAAEGAAAPSPGSKAAGTVLHGGKVSRSVRELLTAPHLRTRHFAADCLLSLILVCVAANERHRDASALDWHSPARRSSGSSHADGHHAHCHADLLITKLQALVDVGFKLATCPLESLRPHGVRMLTLLVQLFGDVPDPLLPGARLMEQYQAQVVSALRSSLGARQAAAGGLPGFASHQAAAGGGSAADNVQHPLLQIAGGVLATCFLDSGLAAGDAVVLRRLMELLSWPLSSWQSLRYEPYAEWVGARARVELLRAHAQCSAIAAAAAARGDPLCSGIVAKAQQPHTARLQAMWTTLLQDHAVICTQPEEVLASYSSPLLDGSEGGGSAEVLALPSRSASTEAPPESPSPSGAAAIDSATGPMVTQTTSDLNGVGEEQEGGVIGEEKQGGGEFAGLTPALAAVLQPVYAAACPAALAALAGMLPPAAELAVDAAARAQFRRLLEVGLMLLTDAAARVAQALHDAVRDAAASPVAAALDKAGAGRPGAEGGHGALALAFNGSGNGNNSNSSSGSRSSCNSQPPAAFKRVRATAMRLAGVLRALQRFLSGAYVAVKATAAAATYSSSPVTASAPAQHPPPPAPEPLVLPAVLRDTLEALGSTAAHVLHPMHGALLSGLMPASLGGLLPGLLLPCCAVVREVCGSAPEECLWAGQGRVAALHAGGGDSSDEDSTAGRKGRWQRQQQLQQQPPPAQDGEARVEREPVENGCSSPVRDDASPRGRNSANGCVDSYDGTDTAGSRHACITAAGVEAILLLSSVSAPYSYGRRSSSDAGDAETSAARVPLWLLPPSSRGDAAGGGGAGSVASCVAGGGGGNGGMPDDVVQGCMTLPSLAADQAAGLAQCTVQLLAAAQQLLRRAPWPALEPHVGTLLELPLRLILTAAPGNPTVTAAQRYLDTAVAALLARQPPAQQPSPTAAASPAGAGPDSANGGSPDGSYAASPAAYADAIVVALAGAVALHIRMLSAPKGVSADGAAAVGGEGAAAVGGSSDGADSALLLGRLAALLPALLSTAAAVSAAEPAPQPQSQSQPAARSAPAGKASPGASPASRAAAHRGHRNSSTAGSPAAAAAAARGAAATANGGGSLGNAPSRGASPNSSGGTGGQCRAARQGSSSDSFGASLSPTTVRGRTLAVLVAALGADVPAAAAHVVLEAVRTAVQEVATEDGASARGQWGRSLVCAVTPAVMERIGSLVAVGKSLGGAEQSVAAECLKLQVLAATLAGLGPAQDGVMQVLVPLLVELAAPAAGPAAATPALRDMAIKLITSLPAAAAGASFKTHLAAQPPAAKLRLQAALREAATAAAAPANTGAGGGGGNAAVASTGQQSSPGASATVAAPMAAATGGSVGRRPAIQLKTTFALPLPNK